jgi:Gti1/Pac2 family transcription factor
MDTYHGHVRTPADAIKLFEACRLGLLPRVQRRLSEKERQSIKSGSVFVWDEREAGMRRWTDGKSWSASRVSGSFLTYREMEGKRGGGQFAPPPTRRVRKTPDSGRGSDEDQDMDGDGPDGYRYKPDGLMKQSFSITTSTGQHLHLISYYSRPNPNSPELPQPTTDPQLRHIVPVKGMYPESTVNDSPGPAVTRAPMQATPYTQSQHQQPPQIHGSPSQSQRAPQPYGYPLGYTWPPSPVSTPPYPGQYAASGYSPSLPPPPSHQSPYQAQPGSEHSSPYQNQHPPSHSRPPTSGSHGSPHQTPYDRPLPPLSDTSLPPPPPPPQQHRGLSNPALHNTMPAYQPNPSPRIEQSRVIAEQQMSQQRMAQQQAIAQRALQSTLMVDPRISQAPTSLPPVNGMPRTSTPPQHFNNSQSGTPQSNGRPVSPNDLPKSNTMPSQAQSIPSISHLVHATDSVSVMSDNKSNSSRAGSKSPKDNVDQRPQDIPHEKLNTRVEDQRAIRVLDQKFAF